MVNAPGSSPGSLVHRGTQYVDEPILQAHQYGPAGTRIEPVARDKLPTPSPRLWLEVTGVHDRSLMARVQETYGVAGLAMEDAMATDQRPKFEEEENGGFLVLRMVRWVEGAMDEEQVSVWWKDDVLVSFQERPGDCFQTVRQRVGREGSRIRQHGSPYLAYALADAVVDHLFVVLEALSEEVSAVEESILDDWHSVPIGRIQELRRTLLRLRRAAAPMRDAASAMAHGQSMPRVLHPYLRDLQDHAVQALDLVEQQREVVAGLRDLWMNAQATHMNRVMQTLTVVATVFIPLTFLAGVYGMNFEHMPELDEPIAYPLFLLVCATLGVSLVLWFRTKGWLGST